MPRIQSRPNHVSYGVGQPSAGALPQPPVPKDPRDPDQLQEMILSKLEPREQEEIQGRLNGGGNTIKYLSALEQKVKQLQRLRCVVGKHEVRAYCRHLGVC
ncbi:hypothetical protein K470DRAFT_268485 [Piedraia hortae CBS 480.64]|uniref:Uncharacterized protein n=1 Tax=Piedraia hortae CBS 480.64 TaxID=1314780 RepID=A0A6A7C640_9PEZI|nr:hypothetical protein K470DRAFT_268485 [Piedraia hortae CBS 480.64]